MLKSVLRMLEIYMCFNGTGIWSGETIYAVSNQINFTGKNILGNCFRSCDVTEDI